MKHNHFKTNHPLRAWVVTGISPSGDVAHFSVAARTPIEAQSEMLRKFPFYRPKGAILEEHSLLMESGKLGSVKVAEQPSDAPEGLKTAAMPDSEEANFGWGWIIVGVMLALAIYKWRISL